MIRRLAGRAAVVDLPMLVLATVGSASIVVGWALATAAWTPHAGVPAVTLAAVALLPLWAVVSLLMSFALPRPALAGRTVPVAAAAPPAGAQGAAAPIPAAPGYDGPADAECSGMGALYVPATTSPAAGRLPARVAAFPIAYYPGRATVPAHHSAPAAATAGALERSHA